MPIQRFGSTLDLEGAVQRLHGAAARRAPRREPRRGDVPLARVGGLAGLRLRLRLQPDAGAAAAPGGQGAAAPAPTLLGRDLAGNPIVGRATTATAAPRGRAPPAAGRSTDERPRRRAPGRSCPTAYRYAAAHASTARRMSRPGRCYVVGGLYGNVEALDEVARAWPRASRRRRRSSSTATSTGSTSAADDFRRVQRRGAARTPRCAATSRRRSPARTRAPAAAAPIPLDVSDARRRALQRGYSARLRETARALPRRRAARSPALPMHARGARGRGTRRDRARRRVVARRLGVRAGRPRRPGHRRWLDDAFATSRRGRLRQQPHLPAGAARVRLRPRPRRRSPTTARRACRTSRGERFGADHAHLGAPAPAIALYGARVAGVFVDALAVRYDTPAWQRRFLASWPAGSAAHDSYFRRIAHGPGFARERARRKARRARPAAREGRAASPVLAVDRGRSWPRSSRSTSGATSRSTTSSRSRRRSTPTSARIPLRVGRRSTSRSTSR